MAETETRRPYRPLRCGLYLSNDFEFGLAVVALSYLLSIVAIVVVLVSVVLYLF